MADKETVERVQEWFGEGRIKKRDREKEGWAVTWQLTIKGRESANRVVEKIDTAMESCQGFRESDKAEQYKKWKMLLDEIEKEGSTRATEKMIELAHGISGQRDDNRIEELKQKCDK